VYQPSHRNGSQKSCWRFSLCLTQQGRANRNPHTAVIQSNSPARSVLQSNRNGQRKKTTPGKDPSADLRLCDSRSSGEVSAEENSRTRARDTSNSLTRCPRLRMEWSDTALFLKGKSCKTCLRMAKPNKTQRKGVDDILRDRARGLTQRVLKDQRHLEEIGREVKAIKMIARKHAKRHR
jgi:hypothetical protein